MKHRAPAYIARKTTIFVFVLVFLFSQEIQRSAADQIPGTAYSGPLYYVSTDMDPISIEFVPRPWQNDSSYPGITVNLPRAYVNYVGGYSHSPARTPSQRTPKSRLRGWKQLPEKVLTDKMMVSLTDPGGEPYTTDGAWLSAKRIANGVSPQRAATQTAIISLSTNVKDKENHWLKEAREKNRTLIEIEGLLYDLGPAAGHFYHNTEAGALRYANCLRSPEQTHPGIYCKYAVRLGDDFLAEVSFLDFRVHGGRSFIVERLGVFLRSMCRYFPCSEKDLLVLSD